MNQSTSEKVIAALTSLRNGGLVIVTDDEDRENEGDFIGAASTISAANLNLMLNRGRGLVCAPLDAATAVRLHLHPMVNPNRDPHGTAFTVSVDAASCTTGIAVNERLATLRALADPATHADNFRQPGHIFPLLARPGGLLERRGHTEAAVELVRLANLGSVGVICEILDDTGNCAVHDTLESLAEELALPRLSIAELLEFVHTTTPASRTPQSEAASHAAAAPPLAIHEAQATIQTLYGPMVLHSWRDLRDGNPIIAAIPAGAPPATTATVDTPAPFCRVHSACATSELFGSLHCDCREQWQQALQQIAQAGQGIALYLHQEGRGIGLSAKLQAYELQAQGHDTFTANRLLGYPDDARDFRAAAWVLAAHGFKRVTLLSNNPAKQHALSSHGIEISAMAPLRCQPGRWNHAYLQAKQSLHGHLLDLPDTAANTWQDTSARLPSGHDVPYH